MINRKVRRERRESLRKLRKERVREREMGRIWVLEASKEEEMRQKNKISRMKLRFGGERAAEAKLKGKNKLLDFFAFQR